VLLLVLALGGCSATRVNYTVLEPTMSSDVDLNCPLIDDEIVSANRLRDTILEAHGDVIGDAVKDTAIKAVTNPVGALTSGVMKSVTVTSAAKHYTEAAAAAGVRMEQLLRYKREQDCPTGPTFNPSMTDEDILDGLDAILEKFESEQITAQDYIWKRRSLLDQLR